MKVMGDIEGRSPLSEGLTTSHAESVSGLRPREMSDHRVDCSAATEPSISMLGGVLADKRFVICTIDTSLSREELACGFSIKIDICLLRPSVGFVPPL